MRPSHHVFFAAALLFGCSSSKDSPVTPAADDAGTDTGTSSTDVSLTVKLTVPPSTETHRCQLVQIPNKEVWVSGLEHHYTKGSHHFLMYGTSLKAIPAGEEGQTECPQGDEGPFKYAQGLIYASQTADGKIPFPDGVGMHLDAGAVYLIQSHYINSGKDPIDATVTVTFHTTTADKVTTRAAPFLFFDPFIYLPAKSTGKSMTQSCGMPADITLLTAFSHYHQRGTKMTVWRDPDKATPSTNVVYSSTDWENPPFLAPSLSLKKGEHIRFQCEYDNTGSDTDVIQGPTAKTNEMCAFIGIYYPAQPVMGMGNDFWACGYERQFTETGDKLACLSLATCLQGCPATDAPRYHPGGVDIGPCWQKCAADACPGALGKVFTLANCQAANCAAECKTDACITCLTDKCADQFNDCSAHACPAK
ncbi:MAG: monooxygenase [Polyangiales bacterium]